MNQVGLIYWHSHRIVLSYLRTKVTRCLIACLILMYGGSEASVAMAAAPRTPNPGALSEPQSRKARPAKTTSAPKTKKASENRPSPSPEQVAEAPITNPFELMKLASEGNRLGASLTPEGLTQAIKKYKEAFTIYKNLDMKIGMAACLFASGAAYYANGQYKEALTDLLQASDYSKESGFDALLRPMLEVTTGSTYVGLGETSKALATLNRALPMVRGLKNAPLIALTLKGLGDAHLQIGQRRKAVEYLSEAVTYYQQIGDWSHELLIMPLISALSSALGQPGEAMKWAQATVRRAREKNSPDWEGYGYLAVGAAHAAVGNLEDAAIAYNHALALLKSYPDDSGKATVLNNLGLIAVARGDFDRALNDFQNALKLAQLSKDDKVAANTLNNLGTIYYRRGEPLQALHYIEEALTIARRIGDKRLQAAIAISLADASFLLKSHEHALTLLKESAATFKELEEPVYESQALISLADGYATMGRHQEALDLLRSVLASRRLTQDPRLQGYVLREMGFIYNNMGERDEALKQYALALSQLEAAGDAVGLVELYLAWGTVTLTRGDYRKAEELYNKGLTLARTAGLRQNESLILAMMAYSQVKQGNLAQAETLYDQQVAVSDSLFSSARIEELKMEASSLSANLLSPAVLLKFKLGKWTEAFELAEKARARTFLDQMNRAHIDIGKGGDPKLVEQEQALRFAMRDLEEKLIKERRNNPSSEAVRVMAASLKEKEEAYATLLLRLKASNPAYAQLQSTSPVPLKTIQRLLGGQTTLVSYFVTSDKTLAFIIRADSFQAIELPVKEADLRAAILWFRDFASLRDAAPESLKQLHGWLVAPLLPYLKTSAVMIAPHGILHYVPFAALGAGQRSFGEQHTLSHLPSASLLPALRRNLRRESGRVLVASQSQASGLPALRYVDEEADSVARLYHTQPLSTGRATRAELLKRAGRYNVLHIAAHAELNLTNALFSRIRLAADGNDSGALEVREIYGMNLARTNLVVLSACETQLGAQSRGDDIVGLNRAFLYAGAASVIASLWRVDDQATSVLMKAFYGYLKSGMSKAAALQAAQMATRRQYPHPYYWAGFVLTGDPGTTHRR